MSLSALPAQAVWTEKYRPSRLADIKGHRRIKALFEHGVRAKFVGFPPVILYGPPGTGKTSLALALATETYPDTSPSISTLYLNASDERSIEVIRERIIQFTRTTWPTVQRKFVVFDEVETMTEPAQASLRALLDEVDRDGHTTAPLFLFLCNSLYRVHQSLRSRCVALFCGHVPINYVREALLEIQHAEGVAEPRLPSDTTFSLLRGDMRSFVAAIQNDAELNPWDDWFAELERTRGTAVWEAGLSRAPFCILIRHVFLWMNTHGMLDVAGAAEFIDTCLSVQDAPQSVIATVVSAAFDRLRGAGAQN